MKKKFKKLEMMIGTLLIIPAIILYELFEYHIAVIVFMLLVTILCGIDIFKKAIVGLKYRIIGIELLVSIAVIGALIIGEYFEAAVVTYLFMFGAYLERKTIEKTRSSIRSLMDLAPKLARVIRDGVQMEISPDEVILGEQVLVKTGEKISVDGRVIEGNAYVNESSITGEGIPVTKKLEDTVYASTFMESGYLVIEATKVGEDTTFSKILHLVEVAQDKKAKAQKFIERFSKYYTPFIILLSILLFVIKRDIHLSLTLLVIACPGALVISTPVSIVAGIGNGAKRGVLFKGGEVIEELGKARIVAFDKTGTLTVGRPTVVAIFSKSLSNEEVLKIAASGEIYSEHPLAKAIIQAAKQKEITLFSTIEEVEILLGMGMTFKLEGKSYFLGNQLLLTSNQIHIDEYKAYLSQEEELGRTAILVANQENVLGIISIADVVREDAKELVKDLHKIGIKKVMMLTGDSPKTAKTIAHQLGLDEYYGGLLPEEKVNKIKEYKEQGQHIIMIGDGVNDAPALASANLGVAIGGAGKDVAMEVSDVIILNEKVSMVADAILLSKKTKQNMLQNLIFALLVAIFLILGVIVKVINLAIGMLVHEVSVILVILNAVRLLGYRRKISSNNSK